MTDLNDRVMYQLTASLIHMRHHEDKSLGLKLSEMGNEMFYQEYDDDL